MVEGQEHLARGVIVQLHRAIAKAAGRDPITPVVSSAARVGDCGRVERVVVARPELHISSDQHGAVHNAVYNARNRGENVHVREGLLESRDTVVGWGGS